MAGGLLWRGVNPRRPKTASPVSRAASRPKVNSPAQRENPSPAGTSASPDVYPRPARSVLETQIALERRGISPGSIDGRFGSQTRSALRAFQQNAKLPPTGELDSETKLRLTLTTPASRTYTVTSNDLARLQPLGNSWSSKSRQSALDYETLLELVAEKAHSHPRLILSLNPGVDWTNAVPGTVVEVPDVDCVDAPPKAAFVVIRLADKVLEAFDEETNLLAHFPCSIARRVEKRPLGELHVSVIAPNPNYTFDPEIFPESEEARQLKSKLVLPPGPNNPVGTVWIGLDKPGYGIHGTPQPERVGRTESHGCFRLANWNAERLVKMSWTGLPVYVEP
jgi:lipoprotein-anchoring transpeptidase ErfK/SrfK